jgi:AraC-like DNA-binding protein
MDLVTDIVNSLHLRAIVQDTVRASAPWGLKFTPGYTRNDARHPGAKVVSQHVVAHFHMVEGGSCWLILDGISGNIRLSDGDCFLIGPDIPYTVVDNPKTRASDCHSLPRPDANNTIVYGGGGTVTSLVSGLLCFDAETRKSSAVWIPPLTVIRADQARKLSLHQIIALLRSNLKENSSGITPVSKRLAEVLVLQVLQSDRAGLDSPMGTRPLSGKADPKIAAAIAAIHRESHREWTVAALSATAAMSRSSFTARFKQVVGQSPLEYVARWRMERAKQRLRESNLPFMDIAREAGYASQAAFNKAFKRHLGESPGEYRRKSTASSG